MNFKPYTPPCCARTDGPLDLARDLCWRVNPAESDKVTPAVLGAVAYMFSHGLLKNAQKAELLKGLGLRWVEGRLGGSTLQPLPEFLTEEA